MAKKIEGIIVPLITPFTQEDNLDEDKFRKELRIVLAAGVHGVSPGGSTGEGAALTDEELVRCIRIIREESPDALVVAGVIRNSTKAAVKTALAAKAAGADCLMVTPVSYNVLVPDDEGNFSFYERIAGEAGLPVVIYNVVPQNVISPSLLTRLSKIPGVIGVKQSCGGIAAFYEMKRYCGEVAKVFSATDEMIFSTFELGADGAISAILAVFPDLCMQMWNAAKTGEKEKGYAIQNRLYPVWRAIAGNQFPIRIKYALGLMGRSPGKTRSPITHISEDDRKSIESALKNAGFIK